MRNRTIKNGLDPLNYNITRFSRIEVFISAATPIYDLNMVLKIYLTKFILK